MVKKEIFIFIQARSSSKRFPNKVLKKIGKKRVLELIFTRLNKINFEKKIIFLIPKNKNNSFLKKFLFRNKYNYFLGNEKNVLNRFFLAAKAFKAKNIMRITADCPFVDIKLVNKIIKKYFNSNYDYVSNVYPKRSYPDGLDVEIFNFRFLSYVFKNAKTFYDKEHVTSYIQKTKKFKFYNVVNKLDYSKLRVTLDYKNDLKNLNKILSILKFNYFCSLNDLLKVYKNCPKLFS